MCIGFPTSRGASSFGSGSYKANDDHVKTLGRWSPDAHLIEAFRQHKICEDACSVMHTALSHGTSTETSSLPAVESALAQMQPALRSRTSGPIRESTRPSQICQKVFGTAELLEHILSFLSTPDLLKMQRVSKEVFRNIEASHTLQCKLDQKVHGGSSLYFPYKPEGAKRSRIQHHVRLCPLPHPQDPRETEHFPALPAAHANFGSVLISPPTDSASAPSECVMTRAIEMRIWLTADDQGKLPLIGGRFRKMLLCQLPIKKLAIRAECCYRSVLNHDRTPGPAPELTILTASSGITLGALWDTVGPIFAEHRLCVDAPRNMYEKDGNVRVIVRAMGELDLPADDPIVLQLAHKHASDTIDKEEKLLDRRLHLYMQAKRQAKVAGVPIPTFEAFNETHEEPVLEDIIKPTRFTFH